MPTLNGLITPLHSGIPALILLNFVTFLYLLYINRRCLRSFFSRIDKRTWIIVWLVFLQALMVRAYIPHHQHVMYIDESWYMEAGKNMLQTGHQGNYFKSIGWPFMLSIFFLLFGVNNWVAINASVIIGALTVFPIFFFAFAITKRSDLSLLSTFLFSIYPLHVQWSASAETMVVSVFFTTLALFFCFLFYRNRTSSLLWLSVVSIAFTSQIRPENYALILLFIFGAALYDEGILHKFKRQIALSLVVFMMLSGANLHQIVRFSASEDWVEHGSEGSKVGDNWSFGNLLKNSKHFGFDVFNGRYNPIVITLLLIVGLFGMSYFQRKELLFLLAWFCLNWVIIFSSWLQTMGAAERLYINFYPLMSIMASYGLLHISLLFLPSLNRNVSLVFLVAFLLFVAFTSVQYSYTLRNTYYLSIHELETRIPQLAANKLESECIIVANHPTILKSTTNLTVFELRTFNSDPNLGRSILASSDCVLFFEDLTCLSMGKSLRLECDKIKRVHAMVPHLAYRLDDQEFIFYKILKK